MYSVCMEDGASTESEVVQTIMWITMGDDKPLRTWTTGLRGVVLLASNQDGLVEDPWSRLAVALDLLLSVSLKKEARQRRGIRKYYWGDMCRDSVFRILRGRMYRVVTGFKLTRASGSISISLFL